MPYETKLIYGAVAMLILNLNYILQLKSFDSRGQGMNKGMSLACLFIVLFDISFLSIAINNA